MIVMMFLLTTMLTMINDNVQKGGEPCYYRRRRGVHIPGDHPFRVLWRWQQWGSQRKAPSGVVPAIPAQGRRRVSGVFPPPENVRASACQ